MPKSGEVRASDGRVFRGYQRRGDKTYEHWVTPEAYQRRKAAQAKHNVKRREQVRNDPELLRQSREYAARKMRESRRTKPEMHMLIRARVRAAEKGLPFELTRDDIAIPDRCPVLGIPIGLQPGTPGDASAELDRIDNAKGYVPGNVIVVSRRANRIKNDATIEELHRISSFYAGLMAGSLSEDPHAGRPEKIRH